MRNIFDIITEQRLAIDCSLAYHDLEYTILHLSDNQEDYYIQEGLGESVGNIAKKVIEFIKTLIVKIKELVKKVINFIFGKRETVKKINNEIKAANNGEAPPAGGSAEGQAAVDKVKAAADAQQKETEKAIKARDARLRKEQEEKARQEKQAAREKHQKEQERKKSIKKTYKKVDDIEGVLNQCNTKVSVRYFCPLQRKVDLANKFFANVNSVSRELVSKNVIDDDIFVMHVIDKTFRGRGSFDGNNGSAMAITRRIELEIGEDNHEPREYTISILTKEIMEYLNKGQEAVKYLQGQEKTATDTLNKLLKYVETTSHNNDNSKHISLIKSASSAIGEFVNVMCQSIVRAYDASVAIAQRAKTEYVDSIRKM